MPTRSPSPPAGARRERRVCLLGFVFLATAALVLALPNATARAETHDFRVIVHPDNPNGALAREFLSDAFLKKTTRWKHGEALRPVDLKADSAIRKRFSESVLKRSVAAVRSYWAQRIFSGRGVPPPMLESDEAVVGYVLKHRGAVGYVSAAARLGQARVVSIQ
jgi:ABC-type phosphate transport system substrate-binding protein